jgi:uncharacterized membrane protein YedE/YeeE
LALLGGILIGLASTALLGLNRRIAGISGIFGGMIALEPTPDRWWRTGFVAGLVLGGVLLAGVWSARFGVSPAAASPLTLIVAGLLVGFGTRMGSGCTSGHGVCGLSRTSPRSLAATMTFIGVGVVTVTAVRWLSGGAG